jgi:uncharacterized damage-inducible protein DinB
MKLLEEAIEAWRDARLGVIEEARNIPEENFGFRPAPQMRDVAGLLRHIMEVSLMMAGELTREPSDFSRMSFPGFLETYAPGLERHRTKSELLEALQATLDEGVERFTAAGEEHMLGQVIQFNGEPASRLSWLHHGIAQEMYHRGQLALYERLLGLEPALTRRIRGE